MAARNVTLRFGRLADAASIAVMSRELIESGLGWSWTPARVARCIRNHDTVTLIAADGARIIAFAIMHFGDEHGHLNLLAVRPSHQRTGIGTRLVDWLMESAQIAGIATVSLELRTSNDEARRFYLALGFADAAYIPGYYRGVETAVRMVRELRPPNLQPYQWSMPTK
jgi:[ribosomal protein S18]-alanine N-acetyltransferase